MAGHIQSIERAVAVLRVIGAAPHDLALAEVSEALDLPKTTTHGIITTLRHVGLVGQDHRTGRYRVAAGVDALPRGGMDPHVLRSQAMNWADSLAANTGESVQIGVPIDFGVALAHHVFCPDGSDQSLLTGTRQPAHATALGKVLLGYTGWLAQRVRSASLVPYTSRTITDRDRLDREIQQVRGCGYAVEIGEHVPDRAGVAAPIRAYGGLGVGAIAVVGPVDRLCPAGTSARPDLVHTVRAAARAVSRQLEQPR